MCVFVSRPMEIVTFALKNSETQDWLLIFLLEKHTFRKQIM